MKNITPELFNSLNNSFEFFNKELFDNKLNPCVLNFSRKSKNINGYFAPNSWENKIHEISINSENMISRADTREDAIKKIFSTLVHEMCHLWQNDFGKPSKGNYHNREWANKMISVGLMPSKTGLPNGKKTGTPMTHYIISGGKFEQVYNILPENCKLPLLGICNSVLTKKISSTITYRCYKCDYSVRGKIGLKITCDICKQSLKSIF